MRHAMSQSAILPAPPNVTLAATYTVSDLAALLQLSERTVWRLTDGGLIPGKIRIGSKSVRWSKSVIDQWIASGCPRPKSR
jgi:excisionase family DNA binding protein